MGIDINKKVDNYLQKKCINNDINTCEDAINEADNYLIRIQKKVNIYNEKINNYNAQISNAKNSVDKYRIKLDNNLDLINNNNNNNNNNNCSNNLDVNSCTNNILCQWDSDKRKCINDSTKCINKSSKSSCDMHKDRCIWKNNSCHNKSKIHSRHNPLNNKDISCHQKNEETCKYPCSWGNGKCVNLRSLIKSRSM